MTNRKLKLAAMSVALTACVAAQPMAAHAVEGPDANADDTATPQAGPTAMDPVDDTGSTAPDATDGEEEKQEEFTPPVNDEAKEEEQAPAFGPGTSTDDITIDYKPAEKPEEPGDAGDAGDAGDTGNTGDAGDAGNTGDTGDAGDTDDTDDTKKPDGTYMEGDVIDNSKKDEATGEDGQVIGSATKEETPESSSSTTVVDPDAEVKKGESVVGKDEDGNTTITTPTETTGTETTTTTGTGKADSSTTITDTKTGEEINLDDELGKDVRPDWKTDKGAQLGGYTVEEVTPTEGDPNSKDLTLKKTENAKKEMSAEDIAKLLDVSKDGVEKKTDDEGNTTYTLTKTETSTDENGNTVTRTTYYEITGNSVKTRTETTLKLKVEKGTAKGDKDLTTDVKLPDSITVKNDNRTLKVSKDILEKALDNNGTYTDGNSTYTVTKKEESSTTLTNEELAERLGDDFTYNAADDSISYKGEKLTSIQNDVYRKLLSYDVTVTETIKTPDKIEGGDSAKTDAENKAKLKAIRDALTKAAAEAGINVESEDFKNQLDTIDSTGKGQLDLNYTDADGNVHTVTLRYDGAKISAAQPGTSDPSKDTDTREDVKDNTVTGTAYVTGSNTWTESGSLNGAYSEPVSGTIPTLDKTDLVSTETKDGVTTKIYKKVETVTSTDGTTTKITYTYTITESAASLTDKEKEDIAWDALQTKTGKDKATLIQEGYSIDINKMDFSGIKRVEWTINKSSASTKTDTKDLNDKLVISGGKNWSIDETANTITVNGVTYNNVTKTDDGYTCTVEDTNGVKTTYTFTKKDGDPLTASEILDALKKKYGFSDGSIQLNTADKTATFTKDGETITVDYSTLSETLTVRKDVHTSSSVTTTVKSEEDLQKAYNELWSKIQDIKKNLKAGESLWIGDLEITDKTEQQDIIKYITKAISPEDMSKDELIKALEAQAKVAQDGTYTANKGTDYEATLKNYYEGNKDGKYTTTKRDGTTVEVKWKDGWYDRWNLWHEGYFYYTNDRNQEVQVDGKDVIFNEPRTDIGHLDLASGSKLDLLPDKDGKVDQTDCVLVSKDLKLEWNYNANDLVNGKNNQRVGLDDKISWDDEGGKGTGHYEYDRGNPNNCPDKSAYYKLTGTVAYDPIKDDKGNIKLYQGRNAENVAIDAYLKAIGSSKTVNSLTKEERDAIVGTYVVQIGTTGTNTSGQSGYQVYLKTSELTAYGYMSRDANTCINSTYKRQDGTWSYVGGYDLMISNLTQVREGKIIGQTESTIKTITAPLTIRSSQDFANRLLELNKQTTTRQETKADPTTSGNKTSGNFSGTYTQTKEETIGADATGTGHYTTFTEILKNTFSGKGESSYDEGKVSYTHRTEDNVTTSAVSKTTETKTDAHVDYDYTTIETRKVTVSGEETVIVPPVDPDTPDEPETPEIPDTPDTPVQDETPDEVVVTPENPELPAVQDATALPQTGVNWFTALGMAFSGMLLMIAGAFTSLKYKEKH